MVGIITYGVYIPRYRIKVEEIARVWGANATEISGGLGVFEKSVPDLDEDTATFAVEAARNALLKRAINPDDIGAVYVGSESHPYAVKPTACTVGEAIGATPNMTAADYEFACKAGTAAIQTCMGLVKSKMIKYGFAIGSDVSQGAPSDALEYTAAAGGAAFLIGNDNPIATINHTCSFTTDTPDFWRREGQDYPRHGGRFTGDPGYFKHVGGASGCFSRSKRRARKTMTMQSFTSQMRSSRRRLQRISGLPASRSNRGLSFPILVTRIQALHPSGLLQHWISQNRATGSLSARLGPVPGAMRLTSRLQMRSSLTCSGAMPLRVSSSS